MMFVAVASAGVFLAGVLFGMMWEHARGTLPAQLDLTVALRELDDARAGVWFRCATCARDWTDEDVEQVQPDGHYVCPLWTGEDFEHRLLVLPVSGARL